MPGADLAIRFFINGKEHVVPRTLPATTSLNDYIRDGAALPGTKNMCNEAGCGCCTVVVTHSLPDSDKLETHSVPSCVTPLYSVDGWQITTVEGIGSQKDGFHPLQEKIAKFNGSQCGYCTPGMVMNMYGLVHQHQDLTSGDVEDSFDGNICRCTGYRPILDAMKSFTDDCNIPDAKRIDIEDLNKHLCPKTGEPCSNGKGGNCSLSLELDDAKWFRPISLTDVSEIVNTHKDSKIRLIYGNTASGIYKDDGPFDVFVDLHRVEEIFSFEVTDTEVMIGGGYSLTKFIAKLKSNQDKPGFGYFCHIVEHTKMVANVMVRNSGSIAGNLMIKHNHQEFPSDLFTLFEAAGAKVQIYDGITGNGFSTHTPSDFLKKVDMKGKVLTAICLPKHNSNDIFRSFKITPRWQNAHAYVNAAFKMPVNNGVISGKPSIVFGGINAETIHAVKTEAYLEGKTISNEIVKDALLTLKGELNPDADQLLASPKYRRELACSLLYKVLLAISRPNNPKLQSGPEKLYRPVSSGLQTYQEKASAFPLKHSMPKKTSQLQASGEAVFVNDMPKYQNELFAAFVLSDEGNATLESVDASEALKMSGVVRFLTSEDIPEGGFNDMVDAERGLFPFAKQEIFATKEIYHHGQPIGVIIAENKDQALAAVSKVKINYSEVRKPILDIDEMIASGREYPFPLKEFLVGQPDEAMASADNIVAGEVRIGSQTHFFLENHVSLVVPSEDGMQVYCATQYPDVCQAVAASVIAKPLNYINVNVPRLGGAFGGKCIDPHCGVGAASLSAYLTGRPTRLVYSLSNVMSMCGRRPLVVAKYKAAVDSSGKIQAIEMDYYLDAGCTTSMVGDLFHHMHYIDMGYYVPHWKIHPHGLISNRARPSPVRAPGSVPAAMVIESIMEHVAKKCNMHPVMLKEINLIDKHHTDLNGHSMKDSTMRECWQRLKDVAEVEGRLRQVDAFNQANLWKKRGLTMNACKYGISYFGSAQNVQVSIFFRDGSVTVTQGGVEMGQGLYTKVAQAVAQVLEVPMDSIKVRSVQTDVSGNTRPTGGSIGSELSVKSATDACLMLKERIEPMREKFPDLDWKELLKKCEQSKIDLTAKSKSYLPDGKPHFNYFVYSVAAIETEVDILTGESQIRRVDLMVDIGESLNPGIDIGQIEGGFVMGLGCYLSEDTVWDEKTGRVLNDGTWEYKPPMAKDIPIDWRIHLLPDRPNPVGIHSSKAIGEPPICLSCGALFANKLAVNAARNDLFGEDINYSLTDCPYTVEKVQQSVGLNVDQLSL